MKMTATQQVRVTGRFTDSKGHPAKVETPQWVTSNDQVLSITDDVANEDGSYSATLKAQGPLGTASFSLIADARLGDGVKNIRIDGELEVTAGEASVGEFEFGDPAEQP